MSWKYIFNRSDMVKNEEFFQVVKNRRNIQKFSPEPVPDEYIEKIIDAAHWAQSGSNGQPWEFVVVKDTAKKMRSARYIESIIGRQPGVLNKPVQRNSGIRQMPMVILRELQLSKTPRFLSLSVETLGRHRPASSLLTFSPMREDQWPTS